MAVNKERREYFIERLKIARQAHGMIHLEMGAGLDRHLRVMKQYGDPNIEIINYLASLSEEDAKEFVDSIVSDKSLNLDEITINLLNSYAYSATSKREECSTTV